MKIYLIILKLILFPYILICQNIIGNDLKKELLETNDDVFIPIIIKIQDDFDVVELKKEFINNNTPIKKRASIICEEMQKIARNTQKPVLESIKKNENEYKNLKSTWIINSIFLEAKKNLIQTIVNTPNINLIQLNNTQSDIIDYIETTVPSKRSFSTTEPGIEAINVRPLWNMGYTGDGLLVFNYDTGVWPQHPAFSDRFFANFYPMNQCWDGYFSDTPNGHVSDHGTHTLGTMAGLVEASNDTIGIAFKSYWIANDFVTSSVATLPPIEDMITSFEWALNPDGDTSTDYDVPDVINNSWRWYNEIDTFQCSGYVVDLMNVIEAAGIANIFSAGNNGPDNDGVRSPQRINTNLVNTFCVGSVNGNDENYPISNFSCRGPTQCPGDGSLSIYPEVVAPGQNVRSAWGEDDFNTISGTSMASPHVSGAVLLLKEAFPFLSGQEILLALYNTATDLGEEGEDNTFGMGLIDVYAAFNYLTEFYDPVDPNSIETDIILLNIENVPKEISCESTFTPIIKVLNNTDSILNELKIYYKDYLNNSEDSMVTEINLNPGGDTEIEFQTIENENFGNKEIGFQIKTLNDIVEDDYHNNRKMIRYNYKPTLNLPFIEDFQNGISDQYWHINNDDYYRTWDTISTGGIINNNLSTYVNLYGYNPRAEQKDELISPNLNLSGDSIKLEFHVAYQKYNNSSKQDTLKIFLSTDCGESFNYKIFEKGGEDLSTYSETTDNFIPTNDNQWRQETISLNEFSNEEIMLKFVTINLRGNNIFLDNIIVDNYMNSDSDLNEKLNISILPNPSNGVFQLRCNHFIKNISIHNNLGQIIMEKMELNKIINTQILNLQNQSNGFYIITIETKDDLKRFKIIKNKF